MMLTGKAKKDFNKWYYIQPLYNSVSYYRFSRLPIQLQFHALIDWSFSIGLKCGIDVLNEYFIQSTIRRFECKNGYLLNEKFDTLEEMIERLNELHNEYK